MPDQLKITFQNWFRALPYPHRVLRELFQRENKLALSFWNVFLYAVLYSITVAVYYFLVQRLPVFDPWLPVALERYYFWQMLWTVPWAVGTWLMLAGIGHLAASAGRSSSPQGQFEDAAVTAGLAWVVPTFYTQWLPETFLVPFLGGIIPFWLDLTRIMIIPVIWQIAFTAAGFRESHGVSWLHGAVIGLLLTLTSLIMFLVFIR